jgi:predicted HAD superfamily Cof-like phosphohydrolase
MTIKKFEKKASPDAIAIENIKCHNHFSLEILMKQFMQAADQITPDVPTLAGSDVQQLRVRLIREELDELIEAYQTKDLEAVADGLTDLLYVVIGSFVAHGINAKAMFLAVHQNNMDKIATGTKDAGGKFVKSPDHLPPDLQILLDMQWRVSPIRADANAVTCSKCKVTNRVHRQDAVPYAELTVLCDGRRVKL